MAAPGNIAMPLTVTAFTKDDVGRWIYNTVRKQGAGRSTCWSSAADRSAASWP